MYKFTAIQFANQYIYLQTIICFFALCLAICINSLQTANAQRDDYDDEGYGPQGGNSQQGDADNYSSGTYGNDDNYSPSYNNQQNGNNEAGDSYGNQGANGNSASASNNGDADNEYDGADDTAAAASEVEPSLVRLKRSTIDQSSDSVTSTTNAKIRVKRSKHYIGPVYTYVKTDKHANFKWGVKHKVGKKHHG